MRTFRVSTMRGIVEPGTRVDGALICAIVSGDTRLPLGEEVEFIFDPREDNLSDGRVPGFFLLPDGTRLPGRRELFARRQYRESLSELANRIGVGEEAFLP